MTHALELVISAEMLALILLLLGGLTSVKVRARSSGAARELALCARCRGRAPWLPPAALTALSTRSPQRGVVPLSASACSALLTRSGPSLAARLSSRLASLQVVLWSVPALMSNSTLIFLETFAGAYEASRSQRSKQVRHAAPPLLPRPCCRPLCGPWRLLGLRLLGSTAHPSDVLTRACGCTVALPSTSQPLGQIFGFSLFVGGLVHGLWTVAPIREAVCEVRAAAAAFRRSRQHTR